MGIEIIYRSQAGVEESPRPKDPQAARAQLEAGNRAFAALIAEGARPGAAAQRVVRVDPCDFGLAGRGGAPVQHPYAAVLGCSDARVPIEMLFGEGPNDIFVVRVAGNGLGPDVLGSLRYATEHLVPSLKLVVVLGHSGCGALSAAVDDFMNPKGYLALATSHDLKAVIDRLLLVVHGSAAQLAQVHGAGVSRRSGYRAALIEMGVAANAALGAYALARELEGTPLGAAWGVYGIADHVVWGPRADAGDALGLADPPRNAEEFEALGRALAGSARIARLLGGS